MECINDGLGGGEGMECGLRGSWWDGVVVGYGMIIFL